MDVSEFDKALKKLPKVETRRPSAALVSADNKNAARGRSQTKEVSCRYRSPSPSAASVPKSSSLQNPSRRSTSSASTVPTQRRAVSAERKRPSKPSSPSTQPSSTPVKDTAAQMLAASRKSMGNKVPEALWPSTMRSLSVSFQSDSISLPVSKREKPVSPTVSDRTLRPSSNVVHRHSETRPSRKALPDRKTNLLKGKNSTDHSENSRPADDLHSRLVDQHRWPSITDMKLSSNALSRSIDFTDKMGKTSSLPRSGMVTPTSRRLSLDGASIPLQKSPRGMEGKVSPDALNRSIDFTNKMSKTSSVPRSSMVVPPLRRLSLDALSIPSQKSTSDLLTLVSGEESGKAALSCCSVDDTSLRMQKPETSTSLVKPTVVNLSAKSQSLSTSGPRSLSPSGSRGVSPLRAKAVNPPSRGSSPTRVRPSSPSKQAQASTSVLSFVADMKPGKKATNHMEDAHQLRLLYNRHLQWRYANAQADVELHSQSVKAETKLYCARKVISGLWDVVIGKRIVLQQLRLKLKLCTILDTQLTCLDEWASIERCHTNSLSLAAKDLRVSTLHVPFTGEAKGDTKAVKAALYSAVDVMQAIRFSLCSLLPKVQGINCLVFGLADIAAQEKALLDECESLFASTAAMQVEEYSLRTHILQLKQA